MEYSKDLLKQKSNSKLSLWLSILFYVLAIVWIPVQLMDNGSVSGFDWFYTIIMLLNGVTQMMAAYGYSVERLVGKAYVRINNHMIQIKTGVFDKEQQINWSEINSIDYTPGKFIITKKDQTPYSLAISKLEYAVIQEIKNVINEIAHEKKISISVN